MIFIHEDYRRLFKGYTLDDFFSVDGEVFKEIQNRRTVRFVRGGEAFFVKAHRGTGWKEIFKNLLFLRPPVLSAKNEWEAIRKIHSAGLSTMQAVGYGEEGFNPAGKCSFLLTRSLENTASLEQWARTDFPEIPAGARRTRCKRALLYRVARIASTMHEAGINHRDFYLCHLRLDMSRGDVCEQADCVPVYIMDLHRAQIRTKTPVRWVAKDLAGLMFSAIDGPASISLSTRDLARFIKAYTGLSLRLAIDRHSDLWRAVVRRYSRDFYRQYGCQPGLAPFLREAL